MAPPKGHPHYGGGWKKGQKSKKVLDKEQARELVRQLVTAEIQPLIQAQLAHAKGLKYLVTRDKKTGKFIRVTEAMARVKLGDAEEQVEVWEKDPSVQAFTDLVNRAIDKPKEQPFDVKLDASDEILAALARGRARMGKD